jgi:hypothetical protein
MPQRGSCIVSQQDDRAASSGPLPFVDAAIAVKRQEAISVRDLTLDERGELLAAVCRDAALLERSKIESGLPPSVPAPWPASTWEFLRKAAAHFRR